MMKHLFTYGPVSIDEVGKVKLKESDTGDIPEDWEIKSLGEFAQLRGETVKPSSESLKYVGLEHIDSGEISIKRWGDSSGVKSLNNRFYQNDVLYGKLRPYLDKAALAEWDGVCSTEILVMQGNDPRDNTFFTYLLHTNKFVKFSQSTISGTNLPRTSWNVIKEYRFAIPDFNARKEIAITLQNLDKKLQFDQAKSQALDNLFKSLLKNLMTGKVRVNDIEVQT